MDARDNRLQELCQGVKDVEIWNPVLVQSAQEVEGEQAVWSGEHQSRIKAVLDENRTEIDQVVISVMLKTLLKLVFQKFLNLLSVILTVLFFFLQIIKVLLQLVISSLILSTLISTRF
jgi:hypothetical protein